MTPVTKPCRPRRRRADRGRHLSLRDDGFPVAPSHQPPAARARPTRCGRLVRGVDDADRLFFERALVMEGDTEYGLVLKNTLDAVGPLWP